MTFSLVPSDKLVLDRLLTRADRAPLSPRQYLERFAPSAAEVAVLTGWATSHGLTVAGVSANRLLVVVSGPADRIGSALGTSFHTFRSADGSAYLSSVGVARLPARVAAVTAAVVGLSDLARAHTAPRRAAPTAKRSALPGLSYPVAYGPQDFWSLYNAPGAQTGSGQSVSVIAEGNLAQPRQDLATFEARFGLPKVTWNQVNVGAPSGDTSGSDEWDLATQYSTGFAPGVSQVNVYDGTSLSNADILTTINRWVTDDISKQASFSAGECELLASVSGFQAALDNVLAAAAAQGQIPVHLQRRHGLAVPAADRHQRSSPRCAGRELSCVQPGGHRRGRHDRAGTRQRDRLVRRWRWLQLHGGHPRLSAGRGR